MTKIAITFANKLLCTLLFVSTINILFAQTTAEEKNRLTKLRDLYEQASALNNMNAEQTALEAYQAEAAKQNNLEEECYARMSKMNLYFNYKQVNKLLEEIPTHIAFFKKHQQWEMYYLARSLIVETHLDMQHRQAALEESKEMYNEAVEMNNNMGIGTASYCIGYTYNQYHRNNEALKALREAVEYLEKEESENSIWMLHYSYWTLKEVLNELGKHTELLELAKRMEQSVALSQEQAKQKNIEWNSSIHQFYCYNAYHMADVGLGLPINAEHYYHMAKNLQINHTPNRITEMEMEVNLLQMKGEIPEALLMVEKLTAAIDSSKFNTQQRLNALNKKAKLLDIDGNHKEASLTKDQIIALRDSTYNNDVSAQLDEFSTLLKVDRYRMHSEKRDQQLLFLTIISLLLLILFIVLWINNRTIRHKNAILYHQISQHMEMNKQTSSTQQQHENETKEEENHQKGEQELFKRLILLFELTPELLADPTLGHKKLTELLNTNSTYLYRAVRSGSGETISSFLNSLRVKMIAKRIKSHPEVPLETLQEEYGFSSYSTFFRFFKQQFGMSPTEFRQHVQAEKTIFKKNNKQLPHYKEIE